MHRKTSNKWKRYLTDNKSSDEDGYALIGVLLLVALALALVASSTEVGLSEFRSLYSSKKRSEDYNRAESAVNISTAWLKENSKYLITSFTRANFYNTFSVENSPGEGANERDNFSVPSKVRFGQNTPVLTSGNVDVSSSFPNTEHIETGEVFDPQERFSEIDFDGVAVRLTLVNALPDQPDKDYGTGIPPETDFRPVYRIDAMTDGTAGGTHVYAYVTTDLVTSPSGCVCDCDQYALDDSGSGSGGSAGSGGSGSGGGGGKTTICHIPPGNPENAHTISVASTAAVDAHIAHGDSTGACAGEPNTGSCDDCELRCGSDGAGSDGMSEGSGSGGSGSGGSGSGGSGKTTICHIPPGNPENAHTISVGNPAVNAHISEHGDYLGACNGEAEPEDNEFTLCHVSDENPDVFHTITVIENEVDEHLSHGDTTGACALLDMNYRVRQVLQRYKP